MVNRSLLNQLEIIKKDCKEIYDSHEFSPSSKVIEYLKDEERNGIQSDILQNIHVVTQYRWFGNVQILTITRLYYSNFGFEYTFIEEKSHDVRICDIQYKEEIDDWKNMLIVKEGDTNYVR